MVARIYIHAQAFGLIYTNTVQQACSGQGIRYPKTTFKTTWYSRGQRARTPVQSLHQHLSALNRCGVHKSIPSASATAAASSIGYRVDSELGERTADTLLNIVLFLRVIHCVLGCHRPPALVSVIVIIGAHAKKLAPASSQSAAAIKPCILGLCEYSGGSLSNIAARWCGNITNGPRRTRRNQPYAGGALILDLTVGVALPRQPCR